MKFFSPDFEINQSRFVYVANNPKNLLNWSMPLSFKLANENSVLRNVNTIYFFEQFEQLKEKLVQNTKNQLVNWQFDEKQVNDHQDKQEVTWVMVESQVVEITPHQEFNHTLLPLCFALENVKIDDHQEVISIISNEMADSLLTAHQRFLTQLLEKKKEAGDGLKVVDKRGVKKSKEGRWALGVLGVALLIALIILKREDIAQKFQGSNTEQATQSKLTPSAQTAPLMAGVPPTEKADNQELKQVMDLQRQEYTNPEYLAEIQRIAHEKALKDLGVDVEQLKADNSCFVNN